MKTRKKNKALLMLITLLSILAVGLGGMLAYLTDRDSEVNVFTLGEVDIELDEKFIQNSTLKPGVKIEKIVNVKNAGKSDAWVWVEIAIPKQLDDAKAIHIDQPAAAIGSGDDQWTWLKDGEDYVVKTATSKDFDTSATKNIEYNVYTIMYNSPLAAEAKTANPAMHQVYLDKDVDIYTNGDWYLVNDGNVKSLDWNTAADKQGNPVIHVTTYGVQKEGFDTAKAAYDAFWKQWNEQKK